jgi:hypothetical protein
VTKGGELEERYTTCRGMCDEQWHEVKDEMKDMSHIVNVFVKSCCAEGADFVKQYKL